MKTFCVSRVEKEKLPDLQWPGLWGWEIYRNLGSVGLDGLLKSDATLWVTGSSGKGHIRDWKLALRDAILGTQAKNSLGLVEHKIEGHFPSHRPSAACAEPWTNIIWSLVWGHFHSHVAVSSKASPTGVWKKVWPLFLDYVSIWEFGHVMGRVTGARQRYWTFYSNSLKSWKFKPLVLCGITKYDNICPLGLWSNPTDYYIQDMCICE